MKLWLLLKNNKDVRIIVILIVLALVVYVFSNMVGDKSRECNEIGGTWIKKYRECEDVNLKECLKIGGFYNFCASPCRHYEEENIAEVCEMRCVPVCEFITPFKKWAD